MAELHADRLVLDRVVTARRHFGGRPEPRTRMTPGSRASYRIALVAMGDPTSPRTWSGTPFGMLAGLASTGATVVPVGITSVPLLGRALQGAAGIRNRIAKDRYESQREAINLRAHARQVSRALRNIRPDLVVSTSSLPVTNLETEVPVVIWADATVRGMTDYYPDFQSWSPRTRTVAFAAESRALDRADLFVASSQWAAATAERDYGLSSLRLGVVPFGANTIDDVPRRADRKATQRHPHVLAVGVDWHRKGMDVAIATVSRLRLSGTGASLTIVGCEAPPDRDVPDFVDVVGFVDRSTREGRRRMDGIFQAADVFLFPTRADCSPVVLCEAAAYGLPVIAPDTGGVTTAVLDGVTGLVVPAGADSAAYAEAAQRLLDDPALYARLARQARHRYERVLNWERAGDALLHLAWERSLLPGSAPPEASGEAAATDDLERPDPTA